MLEFWNFLTSTIIFKLSTIFIIGITLFAGVDIVRECHIKWQTKKKIRQIEKERRDRENSHKKLN